VATEAAIRGVRAASLIIGSRNRPRLLAEAVTSVLRGEEVPAEIVLVDQSDVPHPSLAMLTTDRACEIRYLHSRSVGVSRARNVGIAAARHDILAFIDDDILVTPAWFGALIRQVAIAGRCSVVSGRVLATTPGTPGGFAPPSKVDEAPAIYEGRIDEDVLLGGNSALYRSALDRVGAFDERLGPGTPFPAAEDNDLGYRLLGAGYRIIYAPEALVYHQAWRPEWDYVLLRWRYGRGQGAYYAKHFSLRDRHMLGRMRSDISRHVRRLPRRVLRLERRLAYRDVLYVLGLLSGAARWLLTQGAELPGRPPLGRGPK
jgi:GT2 family glycosyltransferase